VESLIASSVDFEHMFELAPVSLWLEDYSALKQLLDRWRAEGVTDLQATAHTEPGDAKRPKCGTDSFGSHRLMEHVTRTGSR
jgi:hypothetical protein